jgi:hypothetical protein
MNGMPREVPRLQRVLGRSCREQSTQSQRAPKCGLGLEAAHGGMYFLDTLSAWCTSYAAMSSRSSRWPTVAGGLAIGGRASDRPSNFRMQRSALRAAADPGR